MIHLRTIPLLTLLLLAPGGWLLAEPQKEYEIGAMNEQGLADYDLTTGVAEGSNGVVLKYEGGILTADTVTLNTKTGDVAAEGSVRIQRDEYLWVGEHVRYNFNTKQVEAQQYRTGKPPVYIAGQDLHGDVADFTNGVYYATNSSITTDDVAEPTVTVRARRIKVIYGEKVEAWHATLCLGNTPIFYFPYYTRELGPRGNYFNFVPGYRSSYGPFLLSSYHWFFNDELDGVIHLDYREKRGVGTGPDFDYHLGRWGEGTLRYYYLYDLDPSLSTGGLTNTTPLTRQRVSFTYLANPYTNFSVRSVVRSQSDVDVLHDFFEGEYREDPQPNTYVEVNKFWKNFSLDAVVQPRLNDFYQTVERLPDLRLNGYRQQVGETPFYYESESSIGYFGQLFAETNGPPGGPQNYYAARADTYQKLLLPETFFDWLNVTPRVGGRFTYYSQASGPGAVTDEVYRGVFDTGAEVTFKASRVWPAVRNDLLEMDGLRHILEPDLDYTFVLNPNAVGTNVIPQFDYELPSLRLLPIQFPDYNSIDSIAGLNVLRIGLRNKLQTKRQGEVATVLNWNVYSDWVFSQVPYDSTLPDLYSDLTFKPRSWLTFESLLRIDITHGYFKQSLNTVTFQPNDVWSWTFGQFYLRNDPSTAPLSLGPGVSLFASTMFYRLNENWGLRALHQYDALNGVMEEQDYSIYRDLRTWTAALTFRVRKNSSGPNDVGVAFTFSLKAFPRFGLGADAVRPAWMLGG